MAEWWLDLGSGIEAEHWSATACPPGVRRVALDPLLTSGMVSSGRLAALPPDILRVGAEVRPPQSVEAGKQLSFLPFRSDVFTRVYVGFLLHLYLEILELLAQEVRRVLAPGGELQVLLPHFGDADSERNLHHTVSVLRRCFGNAEVAPNPGPYTTFWSDLYRDQTNLIRCRKAEE